MEEIKHWAESLQSGDRVKATIRHKKDGSLNRVNIGVIVVDVQKANKSVTVFDGISKISVPFNELTHY